MNSDNKYVLAFVTPFIDELHGHNENSSDNIENYLLIDSIVELDDFYQYNIDEIKGFCLNMIYIFMQTTTNRNVINNYNRIYQHLLKSSVDIVEIVELTTTEQENLLKPLLREHLLLTKSEKAQKILNTWDQSRKLFKVLIPPSEREKTGLKL